MRLLPLPCVVLLASVALASGCSGDADDGADDGAAAPERGDLAERTASAFEAAGLDGERVVTPCFALDDEGLARVASALGIEGVELDDPANLTGSVENGNLLCSFVPAAGSEVPVSIRLGTTDDDLDAALAVPRERQFEITERDVPGLDAGTVVGIDQGEDFGQALWLQDGVLVAVGAPPETVDLDTLVEALPVLVDEIDRVLPDS